MSRGDQSRTGDFILFILLAAWVATYILCDLTSRVDRLEHAATAKEVGK